MDVNDMCHTASTVLHTRVSASYMCQCFIHVSVLHTCVSASYMCQCDLYQTCLWCIVRLEKVQDARMAAAVLLLVKGKVSRMRMTRHSTLTIKTPARVLVSCSCVGQLLL
jgi:hypothetical protein